MAGRNAFRFAPGVVIFQIAIVAVACAAPAPSATAGPPDMGEDWTLTFESEFEKPAAASKDDTLQVEVYDTLAPESDNAKWEYRKGPNKQAYAVEGNAFISEREGSAESVLVLRTSEDNSGDGNFSNPMRTGYVRTRNYRNTGPDEEMRFAQRYGYFEARMILDTAPGQWGAFWLMPFKSIWCADASGRDGTEIDIVEGYPRKGSSNFNRDKSVHFAIHYDGYRSFHQKEIQPFPADGQGRNFPNFDASEFHTYGLLWTPDKYVWYVDGYPVHEINDPDQIAQVPKYVKLSTEVAEWSGQLNSKHFPADTMVDWVRVWQTDRLAKGNPYIFEVEDESVERAPGVSTQSLKAGTWCESVFAKTERAQPGRITIPISDAVHTNHIGIRVSNPQDASSRLELHVDGKIQRVWNEIDLDSLFILKHGFDAMIADEIEIVWSGGIAIDQVYLIPSKPVLN
ncbi:MAG: glycoside hydrolase family 16 protein [Henriciella sp.]